GIGELGVKEAPVVPVWLFLDLVCGHSCSLSSSAVRAAECPVGDFMAVRSLLLLLHAVVSVTSAGVEPVAAQARSIRAQDDAGMLGGPQCRIAAVCCLVRAAQFLATVPEIRRMIDPRR